MNIQKSTLELENIQFLVLRKRIRNLHLIIRPPLGQVRVSAPVELSDEAIRAFIVPRLPWIRKHQLNFLNRPWHPPLKYETGERHFLWGRSFILKVISQECPPRVELDENGGMHLYIRQRSRFDQREKAVIDWYRKELDTAIHKRLGYWENIVGARADHWGIKRMKTRWGTCNPKARRIWLNVELAKKPEQCLEYVIVHELTHLFERSHNHRFKAYMDAFMPQWRDIKKELNQTGISRGSGEC